MDKMFEFFSEKTIRYPSFTFTGVDGTHLDKFREVVNKVKERTKTTVLNLDYDVINKRLSITGTSIDLYWFGYYTKELE